MIRARERFAYAAGDVGFNFVWYSTELFLLYFYVRVLGLPPRFAAAVFLAASVIDLFADPLIGTLVDRTRRIGFRHWVMLGGGAASMLLVACFSAAPVGGAALEGYALAMHVAMRVAYSFGNIPYAALTARLSNRPVDHLRLTSARMQGAALGGLAAAGLYAALPQVDGRADFSTGTLILAAVAVPLFAATALGVTERHGAPASAPRPPAGALVRLLAGSAPVRRLLAAIFTMGIAISALLASLLFLFERMGRPDAGHLAALLPPVALFATSPLWAKLGARAGPVCALRLSAALAAASPAALLAVGGPPVPVAVLLVALAVAGGAGMSVLFWSLVPAVVAELERDGRGVDLAGAVYGLATTARKLAQGAAPLVATAGSEHGATIAGPALAAVAALAVALLYPPRVLAS